MRVLVVDDERDLRDGIAEVLEEVGHEVVTAANGAEALDRARQFGPAVILLDLMMPVMNGWQFLDAQNHDDVLCRIPVVVVSAASRGASSPAVVEHLPKPFSVPRLLSVVDRVRPPSA